MQDKNELPADTRDMYMAHAIFRREFGLMPALVRGVADGDAPRAEVVAGHIELVDSLLHHHHHAEDVHLWPRLLDRAAEDVKPLVHTMESQHGGVEKLHGELVPALRTWRGTAVAADGERVAALVDELVVLLDAHLGAEEEFVLPIVEKHITAAEWEAMVQDEAANVAPELIPVLFGMMMYEADPELLDELVVSNLPPEIQPVIKQIGSQAYAAHAEAVYGTATPPRALA